MEASTERILKGNDIEISGRVQLNNVVANPMPSAQVGSPLGEPQVTIVENTSTFAVIEVICAYGHKTQIRCDYAAAK